MSFRSEAEESHLHASLESEMLSLAAQRDSYKANSLEHGLIRRFEQLERLERLEQRRR